MGINGGGTAQAHVHLRVDLQIKGIRVEEKEPLQGAVANGGGTPVRTDVQWGVCKTHNEKTPGIQHVQSVSGIVRRKRNHSANVGLVKSPGIRQTFGFRLGHAPGDQRGNIHLIRDGQKLKCLITILVGNQDIRAPDALSLADIALTPKRVHIVIREAKGRKQAEIAEVLSLQIILGRGIHGILRHLQAGKKTDAEGDNQQ